MYGIGVAHCILVTATFPWKWVWGLGIILSIWVFDNLLLNHVGLDHGLYLTGFSISRTLRQSNITLWIIELLTSQPKISLNSFLYPRDKVIAVLTITEADVDIHIHLSCCTSLVNNVNCLHVTVTSKVVFIHCLCTSTEY